MSGIVPASCHYKNIIKNGIQDGIQKLIKELHTRSQLIFIISFIIYEDTYLRQE
jgi:hypothetical protein